METIRLGYGRSEIEIPVDGAKSVTWLQAKDMPKITDVKEAFKKAVLDEPVGSLSLNQLIGKHDPVTIVISDITRFWMRQDLICQELVSYLHDEIGMDYSQIVILIALGTHRGHTEEEQRQVVGEAVCEKVRVVNHDCMAEDLVTLGTTSRGTVVQVNPLAVGRKVILIGGTVHHLMSGFGGGRKSILPGISGKSTIVQNHLHCLDPEKPCSSSLIGSGVLDGNPVHEDMMEAGAMVAPVFGINVVANPTGGLSSFVCGHWAEAWLKSCEIVQEYFGVPIHEEADIVIASCGGFPKDINLYQGIKGLLNMSYAVKKGGLMIFIAECRDGGGSPDFFDWRIPLQKGILDQELREKFTIAGYIFYAGCEAIEKGRVRMLTSFSHDLSADVLHDMKIEGYTDVESLLEGVDFTGKTVYVMPYANSTVPCLS